MTAPTKETVPPSSDWWTHDYDGNWWDGGGAKIPIAPMQPSRRTIPHVIAEEAWKEYRDQGHGSQSLQRLNERGGFSAEEIITLLYERIRRIQGAKS